MQKLKGLWFLTIFVVVLLNTSFVYADDEIEETDVTPEEIEQILEATSEASNIPVINSRNAVVYDRISGKVIFGKSENTRCKMASTTKIMSSIIVVENVKNLNEKIKISSKAAGIGGSRLGLHTNDEISVKDLLYGLLLCSR